MPKPAAALAGSLFVAVLVIALWRGRRVKNQHPIAPLKNQGNSCFINSVFQLLSSVESRFAPLSFFKDSLIARKFRLFLHSKESPLPNFS